MKHLFKKTWIVAIASALTMGLVATSVALAGGHPPPTTTTPPPTTTTPPPVVTPPIVTPPPAAVADTQPADASVLRYAAAAGSGNQTIFDRDGLKLVARCSAAGRLSVFAIAGGEINDGILSYLEPGLSNKDTRFDNRLGDTAIVTLLSPSSTSAQESDVNLNAFLRLRSMGHHPWDAKAAGGRDHNRPMVNPLVALTMQFGASDSADTVRNRIADCTLFGSAITQVNTPTPTPFGGNHHRS
jgi:hypothetical protein